MFKDLSLLLAKAIPREGSIYDAKTIRSVFGYKQSVYLLDTVLCSTGIIRETKTTRVEINKEKVQKNNEAILERTKEDSGNSGSP